jgi:hypothetical protein
VPSNTLHPYPTHSFLSFCHLPPGGCCPGAGGFLPISVMVVHTTSAVLHTVGTQSHTTEQPTLTEYIP